MEYLKNIQTHRFMPVSTLYSTKTLGEHFCTHITVIIGHYTYMERNVMHSVNKPSCDSSALASARSLIDWGVGTSE